MKITGVIPARLQSSRLPRKLLLNETGMPLIQYIWEVATSCGVLDEVIVATDSEEIQDAVTTFGGRALLTGDHPSGTDRIAEVVSRDCPDSDIIINLQGDEPELEAETIAALVETICSGELPMATVAAPIHDPTVVTSPDCVKVVLNDRSEAMYFSRAPIPYLRDGALADVITSGAWYLHVGLYAYRREFLLNLTQMPVSSLEALEKLEQLRALQSGAGIGVAVVPAAAVGIDTAEDYAAFVARQG